jgi:2-polyprenyl-3-methyl-5-hydroxy-6-metoxy-1,4-benzoquinol methylase
VGKSGRIPLNTSQLKKAQEDMVRRGEIVGELIERETPELFPLFQTYQNEAIAARQFLESSLCELDFGATVLEVGGGILALTLQLASEGYQVTTVEPVGQGFDGIKNIMQKFIDLARSEGLVFELIEVPIENYIRGADFDFIFSINVMEHLKDPYAVILQLTNMLKPGQRYRFFCPNYAFPYEPHFAKWIWIRKKGAFFLAANRVDTHLLAKQDSLGLYRSLNFLTLGHIKKYCKMKKLRIIPNRNAFFNLLERASQDQELMKRHAGLETIIKIIFVLNLFSLAKLVPRRFQPVIDVEISRDFT